MKHSTQISHGPQRKPKNDAKEKREAAPEKDQSTVSQETPQATNKEDAKSPRVNEDKQKKIVNNGDNAPANAEDIVEN